jgi:hypothetical protein
MYLSDAITHLTMDVIVCNAALVFAIFGKLHLEERTKVVTSSQSYTAHAIHAICTTKSPLLCELHARVIYL